MIARARVCMYVCDKINFTISVDNILISSSLNFNSLVTDNRGIFKGIERNQNPLFLRSNDNDNNNNNSKPYLRSERIFRRRREIMRSRITERVHSECA